MNQQRAPLTPATFLMKFDRARNGMFKHAKEQRIHYPVKYDGNDVITNMNTAFGEVWTTKRIELMRTQESNELVRGNGSSL